MLSTDRPLAPGPAVDMARDTASTALRRRMRLAAGLMLLAAGFVLWRLHGPDTAAFLAINALGATAPALWSDLSVAGLGLCAWIYLTWNAQQRPARVARLLWVLVAGGLVIHWIKQGFGTPRPLAVLGPGGMHVIGASLRTNSMPSGHSAMAFAMLGLLLEERDAPLRSAHTAGMAGALPGPSWPALAAWGLLALGIATSRMAVGAHWPADVAVGAGLGLAFAGLAPRAWPVAALTRLLGRPLGARLMALGLVVSAGCIAFTPSVATALGLAGHKLARMADTGYPLAEPLQWALGACAIAGAGRWWIAARRLARPG